MIKQWKSSKSCIWFPVGCICIFTWIVYISYNKNTFDACQQTGTVKSGFCNCTMIFNDMGNTVLEKRTVQSQCSDKATAFGLNQKVISYSFYAPQKNDLKYLKNDRPKQYSAGVLLNLKAMRKYFKDWKMRLYTESAVVDTELCSLECNDNDFFLCDAHNIPGEGDVSNSLFAMMWRYLPIGDPTVNFAIFRDLDSKLSLREKEAVYEWIASNYTYHAMRDHPHHRVPILGGLFGAKNIVNNSNNFDSNMFRKSMFKANSDKSKFERGFDQNFLAADVYPHIKFTSLMVHDSYQCNNFNDSVPFPTQREKGQFVGSNLKYPAVKIKCPTECRPNHGKNWTYC